MAGTQGGLLSGVVLTEVWIITGCVLAWRSRALPRTLCVLGAVGLVYPLGTAASLALGGVGEALWLLSVASLVVGLPVWVLASGLWALVASRTPAVRAGATAGA